MWAAALMPKEINRSFGVVVLSGKRPLTCYVTVTLWRMISSRTAVESKSNCSCNHRMKQQCSDESGSANSTAELGLIRATYESRNEMRKAAVFQRSSTSHWSLKLRHRVKGFIIALPTE